MGCVQNFPNKEKMKMNVYDFDNTIYDGESFLTCLSFFSRKTLRSSSTFPTFSADSTNTQRAR